MQIYQIADFSDSDNIYTELQLTLLYNVLNLVEKLCKYHNNRLKTLHLSYVVTLYLLHGTGIQSGTYRCGGRQTF